MEFPMQHRPHIRPRLIALAVIVAGLLATTTGAQKAHDVDTQPDPELERQTFKVADGFEVSLFAADPLVAKPIEITVATRTPAMMTLNASGSCT